MLKIWNSKGFVIIILEILSKGIVYGSLDKQCASFAIQLFSPGVEQKLVQNKAYNEALFTKLVRNWYNACDS